MLDLDHEVASLDDVWAQVVEETQLTETLRASYFRDGPLPPLPDCRRTYQRFYLRAKGVLKRGDDLLGVYLKDMSRTGVGLYAPIQLFPKEQLEIWIFPARRKLALEMVRCRRKGPACYECGTRMVKRAVS